MSVSRSGFSFSFTLKAFILCPVSFYFLSCLFPDCYHLLNVCASILFTLLCLIYNQPFVCVCVYSRVIFLVSFIKLYVLLSDSFVSFWICSPPLVLLLPLYGLCLSHSEGLLLFEAHESHVHVVIRLNSVMPFINVCSSCIPLIHWCVCTHYSSTTALYQMLHNLLALKGNWIKMACHIKVQFKNLIWD